MQSTIQKDLSGIAYFLLVLWAIHLIDVVFHMNLNQWGLKPRSTDGLPGIALMPFLHASWSHLISNTVPLAILLVLLAGSKADSVSIVVGLVLLGGVLLWLGGRYANHIGASGLVYGLVTFLIASGFLEKRFVPLLVAILVGFLYGGSMIWGALPFVNSHISWDGHLSGAIAGVILAYALVSHTSATTITDPLEVKN